MEPTPGVMNDFYSGTEMVKGEDVVAFVYARTLYMSENVSHVQLYSASGCLVISRDTVGSAIDMSILPKGVYFIRLTVSGQRYTKKIILL
jgi:hypothetical protein